MPVLELVLQIRSMRIQVLRLYATAKEVFDTAEMIVKVKEPQAEEIAMLREGQVLYTYLHLAPDPEQTKGLVESGAICVAYETVTSPRGGLAIISADVKGCWKNGRSSWCPTF